MEFEAGLESSNEMLTDSRYGVTSHTLFASTAVEGQQPKRAKIIPVEEEGYISIGFLIAATYSTIDTE